MVSHAQFNRNRKHVVGWQICSLEGANFLDDPSLKQTNDPTPVIEISSKSVELPREDAIGRAILDAVEHVIEHRTARFFRAFAFGECFDNYEGVLFGNGVQFRKLSFDGKNLTVLVFARLAAVNEVFKHGQDIARDINNCKFRMKSKTQSPPSKDLLKKLRGTSASERLLHRLHSVALVVSGYSASEAARIYGDSPRAVAYWVTRYKERGLAGLLEESRPGRPSRLNSAQIIKLKHFVRQTRETSQKVNAEILSDYIKEKFDITFTIRQCWRILKRLET